MSKSIILISLLAIIGSAFATTCEDKSTCPGVSTCCKTTEGTGCCPYENASCCDDGLHCCPNGYVCDSKALKCNKAETNEFLMFLETPKQEDLTPSIKTPVLVGGITDLLKCFSGVRPVFSDIVEIVNLYNKGDKEGLKNLLIRLAFDGYQVTSDCAAIFTKFIQY